MLVMGLGAAMATLGFRAGKSADASIDDRKALFVAEAGLYEGWYALRAGAGNGTLGSADQPVRMGDGMFWVTGTTLPSGRVRLVSTGLVGGGRAALKADVVPGEEAPLFRYTIHSDEDLTLNEGVTLDSYNSAVAPYDPINLTNGILHDGTNGDAASNADVLLNNDASIFGDAVPGPGHVVRFANSTYVHGSTTAAEQPFLFEPIAAPSVPSSGQMALPARGVGSLPAGDYGFDDFIIGTEATMTVIGPAVIVTRNFSGGKDARLLIDATNGPVTFFVQGTYSHYRHFTPDSVAGSPTAVAFMIEGEQDIVFPSTTDVRGGYYAPNARILFANDCEAWGSFAGRRIEMSSSMRFHYDEALADYWQTDDAFDPFADSPLGAWEEVPLPMPELARDRRDPELVLDVDLDELPSPAEAWPTPQ